MRVCLYWLIQVYGARYGEKQSPQILVLMNWKCRNEPRVIRPCSNSCFTEIPLNRLINETLILKIVVLNEE